MARKSTVDGVVEPDLDNVADGTAVSVTAPGPVQGLDGVDREPVKAFEWEVVSLDGKSHGNITIITH
ncbi:hypothetical protein ACXHXM_34145